jgi:hypothetical protein
MKGIGEWGLGTGRQGGQGGQGGQGRILTSDFLPRRDISRLPTSDLTNPLSYYLHFTSQHHRHLVWCWC